MKIATITRALGVLCAFLFAHEGLATVIYESLPASNSNHISRHGVGGPVLADDFRSSIGGRVQSVEWWGGPAITGAADQWEITFHSDVGGTPSTAFPTGVLSQHFVSAAGSDADGDGIFHFQALWNPQDMLVTAGVDYWFSVANASGGTWTWAIGNPPTVGSEQYDAVVSTGIGPNGGPHFGPWNGLADTDFAFRINVVPEPSILALLGIGILGMGAFRKSRTW